MIQTVIQRSHKHLTHQSSNTQHITRKILDKITFQKRFGVKTIFLAFIKNFQIYFGIKIDKRIILQINNNI